MKSIEWFKVNSKDKKGFPIILNVVLLKNPNYPDVFTCPFELEEVITKQTINDIRSFPPTGLEICVYMTDIDINHGEESSS